MTEDNKHEWDGSEDEMKRLVLTLKTNKSIGFCERRQHCSAQGDYSHLRQINNHLYTQDLLGRVKERE